VSIALAKPEPRKRVKARKQRHAAKVVKSIRHQCVLRDGSCRLKWQRDDWTDMPSCALACSGAPEWAHLGDKKRFKTRGQAPEIRHTTAGSLMLCKKHHQEYDSGRMAIDGDDANLPLTFRRTR
jgi:hypothetical protein